MTKKNYKNSFSFKNCFFKTLIIMKLIILFSCVSFLQISASVYSQNVIIDINQKTGSFNDIINAIEDQSEYKVFYKNEQINLNRVVRLKEKKGKVSEILAQALSDTEIKYTLLDKLIVLSPKSENAEMQGTEVTGTIIDMNGAPLPGVNIIIKGTTDGTITDLDGNFEIDVPTDESVLVISYVGYLTEEITVGAQRIIDISLIPDLQALDEVVVVGYATVKKVNLTGSVDNVSGNEMIKRPSTNSANLLQGRLTGVDILQPSAEPGKDNPTIRIRGIGSFGASNDPLILIDGVAGSLTNLAPNDIESVSVLKDAASASIYGSRAANGVILVTTKKGQRGAPVITYSGNISIQTPTRLPDFITNSAEYMEMWNSAVSSRHKPGPENFLYPLEIIERYRNPHPDSSAWYPNFNSVDYWYKSATVHNHSLSISGGGENSIYNASFSYLDQDGMMPGYHFNRYNLLLNYSFDLKKWVTLGTTINITNRNNKQPPAKSRDLPMGVYITNPLNEPYLPDGSGRVVNRAYNGEAIRATKNPVAGIYKMGEQQFKDNNLNGQVYIDIKPFEGLTWTTKFAMDYHDNYFTSHQQDYKGYVLHEIDPLNGDYMEVDYPAFARGVTNDYLRKITPTLYSVANYQTKFGDNHDFSVLAGYEQISYRYQQLRVRRPNSEAPALTVLDAYSSVDQIVLDDDENAFLPDYKEPEEWAMQSFFGRLNYGFKNKYLLEANLRYDGTSKVAPDYRYGVFPSVSAGWVVSEEGFIKNNLGWLSRLKFRGSYGLLGNSDIGNYAYQANLALVGINYPVNGNLYQGAVLTDYKDQTLQWETTRITDLGFDLNINNGILGVTFDWFDKYTYDILDKQPLPWSVGLDDPWSNSGEMRNRGVEARLMHRHQIGELNYSAHFQFSKYKNEVISIYSPTIANTIKDVGYPYDEFRLYVWEGVYQISDSASGDYPYPGFTVKTGDLKMKDIDGNDTINADDRQVVSGRYPDYIYSFGLDLAYKNWSLSIFFQGVKGRKELNSYWTPQDPFNGGMPPTTNWRDAWTRDNPTNELPGMYISGYSNINRYLHSTYFLRDASYLRLKNVMLSYSLPVDLINLIKCQDITVFVSGENLLTFTKFKDQDPESGSGTVFLSWPQARIINFGVNVKF